MSYEVVKWSTDVSMAKLREWFPDGEADELNFVLFSTSGIHGHYCTIEACEASVLGGSGEGIEDVTFLVVMPRAVHLNYGNCAPRTAEDFAFLKKLRASSHEVVAAIGAAPQEASKASIGCSVSIVSDRTCECGTKGCVIKHEEASKVEAVADYQRGWKDGNDTANRAHAALAASPMFWVRLLADGLYEGPLHYKSADLQECRDANPSEWHPLHLHPAPQALSDAKDVARYRHIRSMAPKRLRIVDIETNTSFMEEHADEAIDAAILAAAGGSEK